MSKSPSIRMLTSAFALSIAMSLSGTASAVSLNTILVPIYQVGTTAQVVLGHTAAARTNYNRLTAGGNYTAQCAASEMSPTTGMRTLSSDGATGPRVLNVTIPAVHPARVTMPGFNATTLRGRRLDCTYNWTSRAVEGQYTIGAGGIGYTIGGGEASEGSTELFFMSVPSGSDVNDGSTCTP